MAYFASFLVSETTRPGAAALAVPSLLAAARPPTRIVSGLGAVGPGQLAAEVGSDSGLVCPMRAVMHAFLGEGHFTRVTSSHWGLYMAWTATACTHRVTVMSP